MKQVVKVLCLTALMVGMGTAVEAQTYLRQSVYLNGNIPTGDFSSSATANDAPTAVGGVPLTYTEIGKDASVGFGFGYRVSYRFDVGMGEVAPFANVDFLWNTISSSWRDKYSDAYFTTPTYFNIPLFAGVTYIYDELPWNDIKAYGEFGIGTDLLWITSEGGKTTIVAGSTSTEINNEYAYKANFAFAWMLGAGAYFGEHVSAGIYYYGLGTHNIDYTKGTLEDQNLSAASLPRSRRSVGSLMLRIGFHF